MVKSNKAKLLIDISKEIVKQYRNQLEKFIKEPKESNEKKYFYLFHRTDADKVLEEAKNNLILIDTILKNYENCIFNGEVLDNGIIYNIPTSDGKIVQRETEFNNEVIKTIAMPSNSSVQKEALRIENNNVSIEKIEITEVKQGIEQLFDYIAIPKTVTFPIILDVIDRFNVKNYDSFHRLDKERCTFFANKYFNLDGFYNSGDEPSFKINTELEKHMYNNSLFYVENYKVPNDNTEVLGENLIVNAIPIFDIVNEYINVEANRRTVDIFNLESKNEIKKDILKFLFKELNFGIYSTGELGDYYWDKFHYDYPGIDSDMVDYSKIDKNNQLLEQLKSNDKYTEKVKNDNQQLLNQNKGISEKIETEIEEKNEKVEEMHNVSEWFDKLDIIPLNENDENTTIIKKVEYIPQTLLEKLRYNINKFMLNDEAFEMWKEQIGKQRG